MDIIVVNPVSGNGAALRAFQRSGLKARTLKTRYKGHATEFLSDGGYDRVFVFGGDGTLHEVVNGIMRSEQRPEIVIAPHGSGNDFSKSIGKSRVSDIWKIEIQDKTEYFANTAGFGFATEVVKATNGRKMGKMAYLLKTLLLLGKWKPIYARVSAGNYMEMPIFQIDICNGKFYGGGMKICPDADVSDGMLDIVYAEPIGFYDALALMPKIYAGKHTNSSKVHCMKARKVRIHSEHLIHADGEIAGRGPAEIEKAGSLKFSIFEE